MSSFFGITIAFGFSSFFFFSCNAIGERPVTCTSSELCLFSLLLKLIPFKNSTSFFELNLIYLEFQSVRSEMRGSSGMRELEMHASFACSQNNSLARSTTETRSPTHCSQHIVLASLLLPNRSPRQFIQFVGLYAPLN